MSSLDLDKRKVFSILEQKAKLIESSDKKTKLDIKLSLLKDFYIDDVALLQNEGSMDDILLFIEEQTNRRFIYESGFERKKVGETSDVDFNEKGKITNCYDIENFDFIYTVKFDPAVESINPKDFMDKSDFLYIIKDGDDFLYEGKILPLGKKAKYYKAFNVLYSMIPDGGRALYGDLVTEARKRRVVGKDMHDKEIIKFFQDNLTGKQNGFLKKAKLLDELSSGKVLIETIWSVGIDFNNRKNSGG